MNKALVGLLALTGFLGLTPVAKADLYTLNISASNCCGTGPFGTITVTQGSDADTVNVVVTLATGNVFAKTGQSPKPIIGFVTNKAVSFPTVTTGFSGLTSAGSFPSFGSFQYTVVCNVCGNGTSSPQRSSVSFSVYNASGLSPANFIQNSGGYYWGVDIGVPSTRGFNTFNAASNTVSTSTGTSPVPEPSSMYLLMSSIGACVWGIRKKVRS